MAQESSIRKDVGLIGLGLLGAAVAERLHHSGIRVHGFDIDTKKAGATVRAQTPSEIAAACGRIILCLPQSAAVESVIGLLENHLRPGTMIADATTGSPGIVEGIAWRLARQNIEYADACIGGSSEDVRQGRATVMFGGSAAAFSAWRTIFDTYARSAFHLGPAGAGTRMKLAFNLVLGLHRAVLAEGLAFARGAGIPLKDALAVLKEGAAYSRVMDTKGQKMVEEDFEPQARLSQHLKDVRLILEEGKAPLPFSKLHETLLSHLEAAGHGAEDNSAILRWFENPRP